MFNTVMIDSRHSLFKGDLLESLQKTNNAVLKLNDKMCLQSSMRVTSKKGKTDIIFKMFFGVSRI